MLLDLLRKRYSCRDFSDRKISKEIIGYMLECGRLSPSGGNEQPWKFGVITDSDVIKKISAAASINYEQKWVSSAPLIIVLCTQIFDSKDEVNCMNRFPSLKAEILSLDCKLYSAVNMEEHQTKIPGEHMVIAALEHGIYSTWISSMDCEMVGELVGAKGYLVTNVIAFGYPKCHKEPTPKKTLNEITFANQFINDLSKEDYICLNN
ncbi:MAG: nitroreductase family protein [Defluviitaleaceae bacterium]|nr:nitroreductase family protein [Defluviitaleaceae bacterium]